MSAVQGLLHRSTRVSLSSTGLAGHLIQSVDVALPLALERLKDPRGILCGPSCSLQVVAHEQKLSVVAEVQGHTRGPRMAFAPGQRQPLDIGCVRDELIVGDRARAIGRRRTARREGQQSQQCD